MEPLSKLSLNNQIVCMRHAVRKSKVHTIHKLSREAKKLKEKKGNEEQVIKNKRKAERFVNELLAIKKLNDDEVTKYALQNEVPTATILNSIDVTMETRARARLAGHKFVVDSVQSFRNKYPDWKSSITELLNDLGAKHRAKKKTNGKKDVKVKTERKSKIVKNNCEKIENNQSGSESFEDQSESSEVWLEPEEAQLGLSETPSESETDLNKSDTTLDKTEAEQISINKILPLKNKNNQLETSVSSKEIISKNIIKNVTKCDKSETSTQIDKSNVSDSQGSKLVKKSQSEKSSSIIADNINEKLEKPKKRKTEQNAKSKVINKKKRIMVDDVRPVCETVDSFFMMANDKDYMSVYKPPTAVEKSQAECPKLDYSKPKEIFIKGKKVAVVKNKINYTGNRKERRQQQVEEPVDTALHPSWEAKRKQKSLAKFEGKKITFDDID